MSTRFRQQIDDSILDRAAAVLARQGEAKTSVQDIADAVGLSKAGLLHHFSSKDALHRALSDRLDQLGDALLEQVRDLPAGPDRDREVVAVLVDAALGHPGLVAVMLLPALRGESPLGGHAPIEMTTDVVFRLFDDASTAASADRHVRLSVALAGLAVLSLATPDEARTTAWRRSLITTCSDALGHRRPSASVDDLEA
ncbi:TetR/AcrR family transcriptional regulator [Nakamurella leprariae]|uniref:TetR/AcrR family transcriptional regulator n=1 Tax=Nakamurella leprariae TaxID=2803911 RepID=A0A938YJ95_9ACTN|nr:TetR/AcrR family transcriptional regulator [Nakamurella leprariae]MBM9469312.1 TetR/AcrR family transcriptional regulator [Nakamurella leprariae]